MSGNNFARKVQRYPLRAGKITSGEYGKLRRPRPASPLALSINTARRRWAKMARYVLSIDPGEAPEQRRTRNLLAQCHLVETIYNPTKGWRFRRGEPA